MRIPYHSEGHVPERLACIKSNFNTTQMRIEHEREHKRKYERQSSSSGQYKKNTRNDTRKNARALGNTREPEPAGAGAALVLSYFLELSYFSRIVSRSLF